jgi:lysozyme
MTDSTELAEELIKMNEGCKLTVYTCSAGRLTIGYGRNLEDKGVSQCEADLLLAFDIEECRKDLEKLEFWESLNEARKAVLLDMRFQLGHAGLMKFKKMLAALERDDYEEAAEQIMDSRYAVQTPNRAARNRAIMRSGTLSFD